MDVFPFCVSKEALFHRVGNFSLPQECAEKCPEMCADYEDEQGNRTYLLSYRSQAQTASQCQGEYHVPSDQLRYKCRCLDVEQSWLNHFRQQRIDLPKSTRLDCATIR